MMLDAVRGKDERLNTISPEERRLIDEARARGLVQVIPRGVSAFSDDDYLPGGRANRSNWKINPRNSSKKPPIDPEWIARVRAYVEAGLSRREIAVELGQSYDLVCDRLRRCGIEVESEVVLKSRARNAEVARLFKQGYGWAEIGRRLGIGADTARDHGATQGLTRTVRGRGPDRERQLKELVDAGLTVPEIAAKLGKKKTTIYKALSELGLHAALARPPLTQEQIKMIDRLHKAGLSHRTIASKTGTTLGTVRGRLARNG